MIGRRIDRAQLEAYVAGTMPESARRRVERAVRRDGALRSLLEQLQEDAELLSRIKDSQSICLQEKKEQRIISNLPSNIDSRPDMSEHPDT